MKDKVTKGETAEAMSKARRSQRLQRIVYSQQYIVLLYYSTKLLYYTFNFKKSDKIT